MSTEFEYPDGAWLASAVRKLALDVHRLAARGGGSHQEVMALSGRIGHLRRLLQHGPGNTLARWLDGLQHEVDRIPVHEPACS